MGEKTTGTGTLLAGRFRLEELLQETTGASFWRATDQTLARSVAVHVIPVDDPRSAALLDAARTSATVGDGHFLRVLDAAQEGGVAYVVNEWGSGSSLDLLLADGPLPPRRAAWLVGEVAEAITTAHRMGVAHGRLIPENVMVTESGSVKVIGFVVDAVLNAPQSSSARQSDADPRSSDVVDLGSLLYAALVGRWPGSPGSALPDAPRERGQPLRPHRVRAGVPRQLDAICDRALNAEAGGLPIPTAYEVRAALSDFLGNPSGSTPRPEQTGHGVDSRGEELPPTAAEATRAGSPVFLEGDTAVGWAQARPPESDRQPGRTPAPTPRPSQTTTSGYPVHGTGAVPVVWGPDGSDPDPATGSSGWEPDNAGRNWLRLAAIIATCILLVAAVALAYNLGLDPGGADPEGQAAPSSIPSGRPSPAQIGPIPIAAVRDFDPQGDPPEENPELAGLAVDGDPGTAWRTQTYYDDARLGPLKDGVGLLVDLDEPVRVSRVRVRLIGAPTALQLLSAGRGPVAPTRTDDLQRVATSTEGRTTVDLAVSRPVTTRFLVVWLTSLPPGDGGFVGQVAEIVVRG